MDWNKLSMVGGFLGGIAALGGLALALVSYLDRGESGSGAGSSPPVEVKVFSEAAVSPQTAERVDRLIGLWVAHPMEIFSEVDEAWLADKVALGKHFYDPTIIDASVSFQRGDRQDELVANFVLVNSVFDHRFRAIVKVAGDDFWVVNIKHQKQYGAEPNLKVSSSEMEITTPKGMLYVVLELAGYAEISFWAERRTR